MKDNDPLRPAQGVIFGLLLGLGFWIAAITVVCLLVR